MARTHMCFAFCWCIVLEGHLGVKWPSHVDRPSKLTPKAHFWWGVVGFSFGRFAYAIAGHRVLGGKGSHNTLKGVRVGS